jgi:hypothetical protein
MVGAGFVFLGFYFGLIFVINLVPTKQMVEKISDSNTVFLHLSEIDGLETRFKASSDNLNRIDVLFKNPNLESRDNLKIFVYDGMGAMILEKSFSGFNFGDTSHARLDFEPISNSFGKEFLIVIEVKEIVDGKLQVGLKDGGVDFIHFYRNDSSLLSSYRLTMERVLGILRFQPIILLLPLLMVLIFVW